MGSRVTTPTRRVQSWSRYMVSSTRMPTTTRWLITSKSSSNLSYRTSMMNPTRRLLNWPSIQHQGGVRCTRLPYQLKPWGSQGNIISPSWPTRQSLSRPPKAPFILIFQNSSKYLMVSCPAKPIPTSPYWQHAHSIVTEWHSKVISKILLGNCMYS